ncbi:MAG: DUF2911 domain-containing protein [Gemmatimonadetes bacterium]|nr:DUF2911 domain-containing protein [Gemmatimonadota bacterium]
MSGLSYDASADVGRVPLAVETLPAPVEQLTITIQAGASPRLRIAWGDRAGTVALQAR